MLAKTRLWGVDLSGTLQGAGGVGGQLSESSLITHNSITNNHFPTFDGNGNVSEYVNSSGEVTAHFEYDPYGNTVVNTDSSGLFNYKFSTKPLDAENGLYYYGYRYYDPMTGRWPSRDPIEEMGGVNLYGFVGNGKANRWDILGLSAPYAGVSAVALLHIIAQEAAKKMADECKGGCPAGVDLTQDCVDCCNGVSAASHILLVAAGFAATAECYVQFFYSPWRLATCLIAANYAQDAAADSILDHHNKCTDKCIDQAP